MKIALFVDVADPWSYVAATRLERAAGAFTIATGVSTELSFRAFPGDRRHDSGTPVAEAPLHYDQDAVVAAARIGGIDLNVEDGVVSDSYDAHRLLTWAEATADTETQHSLLDELWRAHFLEGADIADHLVLATRAGLVGLDIEAAENFLAGEELTDEVDLQLHTISHAGFERPPVVVVENRWAIPDVETQDGYVQALQQIQQEIDEEA